MKKWKNICKGLKKQLRIKSNPIAKKKKKTLTPVYCLILKIYRLS